MSDTEQEWKPNPRRPQSTMAQAFSLALDSAFMLDTEVDHLAQSIEQKKQMMTIQARELEALQAKIREAEERLQKRDARSNGRNSPSDAQGSRQQDEGGERENPQDSSTSAATTNDAGSEDEQENKGKARRP